MLSKCPASPDCLCAGKLRIWGNPSQFGLLQQITIDWVAYEQQKFISYSSGVWNAQIKVPAWLDPGEGPPPGYRPPASLCSLMWWKGGKRELSRISLSLSLFFFFLFRTAPAWHMEVPRLGIEFGLQLTAYTTATETWDPSCICDLYHSSRQRQILNLLSEARDRSWNLMVPSRIHFHCATMGTPSLIHF